MHICNPICDYVALEILNFLEISPVTVRRFNDMHKTQPFGGYNALDVLNFHRDFTCHRSSLTSLGFLISDSRSRDHNDEMFFFILVSAAIVMIGDFVSDFIRSKLRH